MLAVSTSRASSERTLELPRSIAKAIGVHPTKAAEGVWDGLGAAASRDDVVAIGETGFDDAGPTWELQDAVFLAQARVARDLDLALVLHVDGADAWTRLLASEDALTGLRLVRHYFRGDRIQLEWHIARGHWISFGRPLLRDAALWELAAECPAELLLIETDSYPLPGRATEPTNLVEVGQKLGELRRWDDEATSAQLWRNSIAAFQLAE